MNLILQQTIQDIISLILNKNLMFALITTTFTAIFFLLIRLGFTIWKQTKNIEAALLYEKSMIQQESDSPTPSTLSLIQSRSQNIRKLLLNIVSAGVAIVAIVAYFTTNGASSFSLASTIFSNSRLFLIPLLISLASFIYEGYSNYNPEFSNIENIQIAASTFFKSFSFGLLSSIGNSSIFSIISYFTYGNRLACLVTVGLFQTLMLSMTIYSLYTKSYFNTLVPFNGPNHNAISLETHPNLYPVIFEMCDQLNFDIKNVKIVPSSPLLTFSDVSPQLVINPDPQNVVDDDYSNDVSYHLIIYQDWLNSFNINSDCENSLKAIALEIAKASNITFEKDDLLQTSNGIKDSANLLYRFTSLIVMVAGSWYAKIGFFILALVLIDTIYSTIIENYYSTVKNSENEISELKLLNTEVGKIISLNVEKLNQDAVNEDQLSIYLDGLDADLIRLNSDKFKNQTEDFEF